MDLEKLKSKFTSLYGEGEIRSFFSPSRINLIGEHIDYNGGKVLPAAIEIGTYGLVRPREDKILNLASENIDLKVTVNLEDLAYKKEYGWANYPKGVIYFMQKAGHKVSGMDILVEGNIPNGAGLSSSASLEILIAIMVNHLFNEAKIPMVELVKLAQKAENDYVGVKCGIMDQFAIGMGGDNQAILLDTEDLSYEYIDIDLKDNILVIMNTNKRRELSDSKYNERREECERALEVLKEYKDIDNLCQLSIDEFKKYGEEIEDKTIRKRAEHVIYENERVNSASTHLRRGEIQEFGNLLNQSHDSLRDLYEVTGKELDTIVDAARSFPSCLGARMTGAGFGGCAIALVKENQVDEFINFVKDNYKAEIGNEGDYYISGIGGGAREI